VGQGFDINWAAFALLAIGVGLLAYELYSPGFDTLGIGGIAIMSIGSVLMITQTVRPLLIQEEHLEIIAMSSVLITLPFGALIGFITFKVWRSKHKSKVDFTFQDSEGTALDGISNNKQGFVLIGAEYWKAKSIKSDIKKGEKAKIIGKQGHILIVECAMRE
jgi:membrane-bound ClpP family serine protease